MRQQTTPAGEAMKRFRNSRYIVFDDGTVYSEKSRKNLKPYCSGRSGSEYYQVNLWVKGKSIKIYIHQIVAELYLDEKPSKEHQINHIDGDRFNNKASNLEWVSLQENLEHAAATGLRSFSASHCVQALKDGFGYVFPKIRDANLLGFDSGSICQILSGKRNKCKGFEFHSLSKGGE